jgi:glycosyltransferase involved in cell wall biosynthesis
VKLVAIFGLNPMSIPELSVIVALQNARDSVAACLDSLLAQADLPEGALEIILVDGSQDGTAEFVSEHYPQLTLLQPPDVISLPELLGVGIMKAQGRLVAITEGHCTFARDWAAAAIAAHTETDCLVIGGVVEPGEELRALDLALYFCDYGQFLLPVTPGSTNDLAGNNVIFKQEVLQQGDDFAKTGFWKTFFCHQLEAQGQTFIALDRLLVYYHRCISLNQLLRRRYIHGRCFGAMRAQRCSSTQRVLYTLTGPLLPGLLTYKLIRKVWYKARYRRKFLFVLPFSFFILLFWSIGEWTGNLFGAGQSCRLL